MPAVRRSGAAALLFLLLAALSALPAFAQTQRLRDVSITVDSPWPEVVARGYVPVFVTLENDGADAQLINLSGELDLYSRRELNFAAKAAVELEPGQ